MRPLRTYGPVAAAMCEHAREPIEVSALARCAEIGSARARYTASRLIAAGELVVIDGTRPMRVVRRDAALPASVDGIDELEAAINSFWDSG